MKVKRIIRAGAKRTRVELENGEIVLVNNEELQHDLDGTTVDPKPETQALTTMSQAPAQTTTSEPLYQSAAERFAHLESLVDLVIAGGSPSLIVCGDAGIGKTHLVRERLQKTGFTEQAVSADSGDSKVKEKDKKKSDSSLLNRRKPTVNSYLFVKGYSSPMGLYSTLHNNRKTIIVFDDCDSVFKDAVSVNILKSALDSYDKRIVSWVSTATEKLGLESRFEFEGKIIFLSNLTLSKLDTAVKSRSFTLEMTLTRPELFHRMNEVLVNIEPAVPMDVKLDALNFLGVNMDSFSEFNMRTLTKAIRIRHSNHPGWREMVIKFA